MASKAELLTRASLGAPSDAYFYALAFAHGQSALAVIGSDDALRLCDPLKLAPIHSFTSCHTGLSCLSSRPGASASLMTAGRDGLVKLWDSRSRQLAGQCSDPSHRPLSAITSSGEHLIAAGTDSDKEGLGDVSVLVFDARNLASPVRNYAESHTDAITQLSFHPHQPSILLSASTDGLVSFFDIEHADEDDALQRVLNPRSAVHCAGFLNAEQAFVLTTDEHFLIYPLADKEDDTTDQPLDFGDVRPTLNCMYVVNLLPQPHVGPVLVHGHNESKALSMTTLQNGPEAWKFGSETSFPGAHGDEVVRDLVFASNSKAVYTCGEDGHVRAWQINAAATSSTDESQTDGPKSSRQRRDKKSNRFAPY